MNMLFTQIKRFTVFIFAGSFMLLGVPVMAACLEAPTLPANELDKTVIVLFGDSITVGFNSSDTNPDGNGTISRGCPTVFLHQKLVEAPIRSNVVVNWGVGGSNSTSGLSRMSSVLANATANHKGKARIVLIIYGTNDLSFGISASATGFNIAQMIDLARPNYEPIIGTLTPRTDRSVVSYNSQIISQANSKNAFIVDHHARFISDPNWPNTLMDPAEPANLKLHPSDVGYLVIAETWFDQRLEDIIDPDIIEPDPFALGGVLLLLLDD